MTFFNMAVVIDQHHGFKPFARSQRCKLQSFTQLDYSVLELGEASFANSLKRAFEAASFHRSFSTPCLSLTHKIEEEFDVTPRVEIVGGHGAPRVRALVVEVAIAMASGVDPVPVSNGLGGAYLLRSRNGDNIAVAKPIDEEPLALNNPKGFAGRMLGQPGLKRSVRVGETGIRELAAYLLDHGGFAGVPPTALVKISHVAFHVNNAEAPISAAPCKIASLQRFVDHDSDAGDLGPSGFSVLSVHRIGILDVRLLNLDRHAGNLLVKSQDHENYAVGSAELVPIDHGFCLPEWLDDPYFEWLHWPQASVPFSESEIEYISNLDPFKDAELLRTVLPSLQESSIRVLVLCTIFLKRAATAGLSLADIGQMMTRESCGGEESLSVLENVCIEAKASMSNISNSDDEDHNQGDKDDIEDFEMFQFDKENEESTDDDLELPRLQSTDDVLELPRLLQGPPEIAKPPKILRFLSTSGLPDVVLFPLHEEDDFCDDDFNSSVVDDDAGDDDNCSDDRKVGALTRSMSFSVQNYKHEAGGISFGDMSENEWETFLRYFEKVLPKVFADAKSIGLKLRLGISCKF